VQRMQRRNSLTLGFRQEEPLERGADEEEILRTNQCRPRGVILVLLLRQLRATSDPLPLIDLGDLASMIMPPKIGTHDDEAEPPRL
jgi:hypothetical protein